MRSMLLRKMSALTFYAAVAALWLRYESPFASGPLVELVARIRR